MVVKEIFLKANMSEKWGKGIGFSTVNGKVPTAVNGVMQKIKMEKDPKPYKIGTGWVQHWINYLWKSKSQNNVVLNKKYLA